MPTLHHRRLDVYRAALDFIELAEDVLRSVPTGRRHLAEQLRRAGTSIVLNIAEGAGEYSRGDKARFYRMALRSATECAAVLDIFRRIEDVDRELLRSGDDLLVRIVSMLTRLAMKGNDRERVGERVRVREREERPGKSG